MALDRFYIPVQGASDGIAAAKCGLLWLLSRPEQSCHISFDQLDNLKNVLRGMGRAIPDLKEMFDALEKNRGASLPDGKHLTSAPWKPWVQANSNGACLVIWSEIAHIQAAEARLGPVGAIFASPWYQSKIQSWITDNNVSVVSY